VRCNTERYVETSVIVNVDGPETLVVGRLDLSGELESETTTDTFTDLGNGLRWAEGPSDGTCEFKTYKSGSGTQSKVTIGMVSFSRPPNAHKQAIVLG
jgi:hypothetical protein